MTSAAGFFRTPRGKLLTGLAAATALMILITAFALFHEARLTQSHFARESIFPNLAVRLADAAEVSIVSKGGTIVIARSGADPKSGRWVVPAAQNYPANAEHLRRLFLGLAELEAVEQKTARPDWHAALSLDDPKTGGSAITLTVKDSKGQALAALFVGKLKPGSANAQPMVYVRRAGENQTYLAQGDLPLATERKAWLDETIVDLSRDRVKRVAVSPPGAPAYSVSRPTPQEPNFAVDALPKGREMVSATAANATGAAAVAVTLDDVRPQSEIDFSKASHITFETFDGLTLTFDVVDKDEQPFIRVNADGTTPTAVKEANAIKTRSAAWAYAVPSWKANLFRKPVDQLLKTPEKPGRKS